MSLTSTLAARFAAAVSAAFGVSLDPEIRPGRVTHFQTSLPLRLAKQQGLPPASVADRLLDQVELDGLGTVSFSPPGFLNITLAERTLAACVDKVLSDRGPVPRGERVVVDYSSPNVARRMMVHHLRSTVIGDALCRVLDRAGYDVVRQNHIGDWGTQFGMLIEELVETGSTGLDLPGLEDTYRRSREHFDTDPAFAARARARVVALQTGDPATREVWQRCVEVSVRDFQTLYERLGVQLGPDDLDGESTYNDELPGVVDDLTAAGLLVESDGALCVFPPGFAGRDGEPLPLIVRKADGGFGYAATDLAAIRRRVGPLRADRFVIVTDVRQTLHFAQVFAVARMAGWLPDRVRADHVRFGTMLGADGRPFRTRQGGTSTLESLLDEAETAAGSAAIGIGAVKYADLVNDRGKDFVYSVDRMIALDGNTGPYLQYAHARLASIARRAGTTSSTVTVLAHDAEQRLALLLSGFEDTIEQVAATLQPHRLCGYLYDVATAFSSFYEQCPVLRSEGGIRSSRLALCAATRTVLADGLGLLGIAAPDEM